MGQAVMEQQARTYDEKGQKCKKAFVIHCNRKGRARFSGRLPMRSCKFFSVRSISKHRDLKDTGVTEIFSKDLLNSALDLGLPAHLSLSSCSSADRQMDSSHVAGADR